MNQSSALRAAAIERATRATEAAKPQVIDRDWQPEEHRLELVATPGEGILAAVEVRAVAHGIRGWKPIERATSPDMASDFAAAGALRVAWTFVDLNGCERPACGDCAAALGLRMGDMR
jgi:hypothetical protein